MGEFGVNSNILEILQELSGAKPTMLGGLTSMKICLPLEAYRVTVYGRVPENLAC
jgi:hypothetical protein